MPNASRDTSRSDFLRCYAKRTASSQRARRFASEGNWVTTPPLSSGPTSPIVCAKCRTTVWLSLRRARTWRGRDYLCSDCRELDTPLTEEERQRYLAWWRASYSPAELESLGRALASLAD